MQGFRQTTEGIVYHDLIESDGLYVREGFSPDLSLIKEWPTTYKKVQPYIEGQNVLDIGANIGIFSRFAMNKFKAESCVCYEPDAGAFSVLKHNVPNGLLFNKAIEKFNGTSVLSLSPSGNAIAASTALSRSV